ncbi:hypothetical protein EBU94_09190, partial [bacterium]|nr:hypothetical protein [bacterium]
MNRATLTSDVIIQSINTCSITAFKRIDDKVNPQYVTPESIIERIKNGTDKPLIDKIRAEKDKKKRAELKDTLHC